MSLMYIFHFGVIWLLFIIYREEISLTIGYTGDLLSVSYNPLVSPLALPCHKLPPLSTMKDEDKKLSFQTTVKYTTATHAMSLPIVMPQMRPPPGLVWMKRPGKNNNDMPQSTASASSNSKDSPFYEPEDSKRHESFLKKYWYIILPLVIITFLSPEEPAQHAEKGNKNVPRHQSADAGSTAPTTNTNNATNASSRQRRGKRGN